MARRPRQIIPPLDFTPSNSLSSYNWHCPMQVLEYLLRHPEERATLLSKVHGTTNDPDRKIEVYHPLLQNTLKINSKNNDKSFVDAILTSIYYQEPLCTILAHRCPKNIIPLYLSDKKKEASEYSSPLIIIPFIFPTP